MHSKHSLVLEKKLPDSMQETTESPESYRLLQQEVLELKRLNEGLRRELEGRAGTEEALRESEARFRGLTAISADRYWEQDKQFRFIEFAGGNTATPRAPDLDSSLGQCRWEMSGASPLGMSWDEHRKVLESREVFLNFQYTRLVDKQLRYITVSGGPVFDRLGCFVGYRGTARDITARKRDEELRRLSMQLLHDIVENIPTAVQLQSVKDNYRFVMWNKAAQALYGITRQEAIGQTVHDLWPAAAAERMHADDRALVALGGAQNQADRPTLTRGRGVIRVHLRKVLLFDAAGEVSHLLVVTDDITDRLQAETRLRESEARFRGLTALSSDWYWEQDKELRFIAMAGGDARHAYVASSSNLGKTRWEIKGLQAEKSAREHHCQQLERHETFHNFEYQRYDDNEQLVTVSVSGEPIFDAAGQFAGYRGVGSDVTERRRTEATLHASEARFRTVVAALAEGVVLRDRDANIVDCNLSAERLVGKSLAEMKGKRYFDAAWKLSREDGTLLTEEERPATVALRTGLPRHDVLRYERPDGRVFWVLTNVQPLFNDPQGALSGFVTTITDITELKRSEQEIIRLNVDLEGRVLRRTAQLEAANKELEAFSYSVAHDLRSPLNAIDGFSALLQKALAAGISERGAHYLSRIRAGVKQMGELTDALLTLAQISRTPLKNEQVDLSSIALCILGGLQERDPARVAQLTVQPGLTVQGDCALLRQVLENLLANAWKFTSRQPSCQILVGRETAPDGQLVYFVKDNGAGFDMSYADKLFGTFQRLHSPGEFAGTGIGLATVQRIIARHDGKIWAEATPELGASFYFTLGVPLPAPEKATGP